MNKKIIKNFGDYLNHIDSISSLTNSITLFRGQSNKQELLPTIARQDPKIDTTNLEKQMLEEFRRRTQLIIKDGFTDDWELLIFAQHFGLKTRLLDWTSNGKLPQKEYGLKVDKMFNFKTVKDEKRHI